MAGARGEFGDIATDGGDIRKNCGAARGVVVSPAFEGTGHGTHAAGDARGDELRDESEEALRVGEALGRGPVGRVDLLFYARAVEAAVGKSVDRKNVAVVRVEPAPEGLECGRLREFFGGAGAEAQTDRVGPAGGDAAANDEGVALECVEGLRPRFAAVDVGAVGEVEAVVEFHAAKSIAVGTALRAVPRGRLGEPSLPGKSARFTMARA